MDDSCLHHTMRTALVKKQKAARRLLLQKRRAAGIYFLIYAVFRFDFLVFQINHKSLRLAGQRNAELQCFRAGNGCIVCGLVGSGKFRQTVNRFALNEVYTLVLVQLKFYIADFQCKHLFIALVVESALLALDVYFRNHKAMSFFFSFIQP